MASTAICTWFVADGADDATFFPQLAARSDAPAAQATYWRCAFVFFALSLRVNPGRAHRFFTNAALPRVGGVDFDAAFARMGVDVVKLPITFRLPRGAVTSWGNQFYIFDILRWVAEQGAEDRLIVLDSDCAWRLPADAMEAAIDRHGVLTYRLDLDEHAAGAPINGVTRDAMARFAGLPGPLAYCGGEIFASSRDAVRDIVGRAPTLWARVVAGEADAPREEAHLLSVLYALRGDAIGTADPFIRRMWTTFRHHNLKVHDRKLAVWHLPAEKKTGFADLFRWLVAHDGDARALDDATIEQLFGFPKRDTRKFARDAGLKLAEKLRG